MSTQMVREQVVFKRPAPLGQAVTHYCPGCTHGIIHRLVAEVIDELGVAGKTIGVAPVGCAVFAYNYFELDFVESPHGRATAVATGIKRVQPDKVVFTYQGDGDLAAIGTGETVHVATRGENITVVFVNNAVYGMTGGQMAPTTMLEQVTTTSPAGRDSILQGHPVKICEVYAKLDGTSYLERVAVHKPAAILKAKKAIAKSFRHQQQKTGFSLVEILSPCPTNWKMSPLDACKYVEDVMTKVFPLGLIKETTKC
jgi:2-oxoglutarate ferredoxin oxidoreductase subunit beta